MLPTVDIMFLKVRAVLPNIIFLINLKIGCRALTKKRFVVSVGFPIQDAISLRPFPYQHEHHREWNAG